MLIDIRDLCSVRNGNRTGHYLFQQDNASPHTSASTLQFIAQNGVRTRESPPTSPDLNPIEYVWSHVAARVRARGSPENRVQLWEWVLEDCGYAGQIFKGGQGRVSGLVGVPGGRAPRTPENLREFAKNSRGKLQKLLYFRLFCKEITKPCVTFSRVWTKNTIGWEIMRRF